jgi:hypothetical protein
MSNRIPIPSTSVSATVAVASAALGSAMVRGALYQLVTSTTSHFKQGTNVRVTCATQANMADTDTLAIQVFQQKSSRELARADAAASSISTTTTYEFDKAGNGVATGNVQVNISTDTTAITVAARLATALAANNPELTVTNNGDGTLDLYAPSRQMVITENVAHASFTVADQVITAAAGAGVMCIPPNTPITLDGAFGKQGAIIRDAADGKASMTLLAYEAAE